MVFVQRYIPDILDEFTMTLMLIYTMIMMLKTFFYLRIFKSLSFLVSMLGQVMHDLKPFMTFFLIIVWMLGLVFALTDWGNFEYSDNDDVRTIQYTPAGPDKEYLFLHKFFARMVFVCRISLGDFNFDDSTYMETH